MIKALRVSLQSPHAAEGCHLTKQGDTPKARELLGIDVMINQKSFQVSLITDGAEFLRDGQVLLHWSIPPEPPRHKEGRWPCSPEAQTLGGALTLTGVSGERT